MQHHVEVRAQQDPGDEIDGLPADFDPNAHPILAVHWFGLRPLADVVPQVIAQIADRSNDKPRVDHDLDCENRLRFSRRVAELHERGPRPVLELMLELIAAQGPEFADDFDQRLDRYIHVSAATYEAVGADIVPFSTPYPVPR